VRANPGERVFCLGAGARGPRRSGAAYARGAGVPGDGYDAVKHQEFVGTAYFDAVTQVVSGGRSSTLAMEGSTEREQFVLAGQ
jgi:isocitrate lyase